MKLLALVGLAFAPAALSAQEVRCLLVEGAPVPGLPGSDVGNLKKTAVSQLGGHACMLDALDGTVSAVIWGSADGGPGAPLRTEGAYGPYVQIGFDNFFGLADDGSVAYGARLLDALGGVLDSVWLDDEALAVEGQPIPSLPGKAWHLAGWVGGLGRAGITRDGVPFWTGGVQDAVSGTDEGLGLFLGIDATPVLRTGDVPPGAPAAIDATGIDFDFSFSAYGTHHLTVVGLDVPTAADALVVRDGAALSLGGALVMEGEPVPASIGGLPGERWGAFDLFGIVESGAWFFTGDTDAAVSSDEIVVRDGVIVHREGDVLDGRVLAGSIEGAALSENGELALLWAVDPFGGQPEALFLEGEIVIAQGDEVEVDVDGDGRPEPGATLADFTIPPSLTFGADRTLYFTADVDHLGTATSLDDVECYFAVVPAGTPDLVASPAQISASLGGTQALFVRPGEPFAGRTYWLAGSISRTSPGFVLGGASIPLNPDAYFLLTIEQPGVPPLVDTLGTLGPGGALARWELPAGALPGVVGITASHAYAVLDLATLVPEHVSQTASLTFVP